MSVTVMPELPAPITPQRDVSIGTPVFPSVANELFTYYEIFNNHWPSVPIGDIAVPGVGILDPQPDITPIESVLISRMLWIDQASSRFTFAGKKPLDFAGFIRQHNLERHFRKPL